MIMSDGKVFWEPFQVFETRCSMNIYNFPFDSQSCDIKFVTWSHYAEQIEITKSSKGIQFYEYEENSVWNIKSTSSEIKTDWQRIRAQIHNQITTQTSILHHEYHFARRPLGVPEHSGLCDSGWCRRENVLLCYGVFVLCRLLDHHLDLTTYKFRKYSDYSYVFSDTTD